MADPVVPRGRGRARARAKPPQQQPGGPAGPPQLLPSVQDNPSSTPSGINTLPPRTIQHSVGRATHRTMRHSTDGAVGLVSKMSLVSLGENGSGDGNSERTTVGRGNMRGKRSVYVDTTRTRSGTLETKKGTSGQKVMLQANYFPLISRADWSLRQYRVDFEPNIDLTGERRKLLHVATTARNFSAYLFDGTVLYYSGDQLVVEGQVLDLHVARETDDSQVRITLRQVGEVMLEDAHYMQVFNILTRNALKLLNLQLINRNYYDPRAKVEIAEYFLELWPGYSTNIRQHENGILMCANIESKVMRTDTCFHLLQDLAQRDKTSYKSAFNKAVIGTIVLTDYNNRTYSITDVDWQESPESTFDRNDSQVSYISYYKERYNITIKQNKQPLLVSKSKPRDRRAFEQKAKEQTGDQDPNLIYLIPELCRMTGLTDEMRSNFNLMKALATHTRIGPSDRINRLLAMNKRLTQEPKICEEFSKWNMKLADHLVDVPGRVLPMEDIILGNNVMVQAGADCDWTKHLRSNPMFVMPEEGLSKWVILFPNRVGNDVQSFVDVLRQAGRGMRFIIAEPEYVEMNDDRTQTYVEKLDEIVSHLNPQLIFVVLMRQAADKYSAVKKKSLVDRAVPTQVLIAKNLNKKGVMSIATKVAIQMNCKIGGAPWSLKNPLGGLMVIGFDVCHDSKSKGKSFGAMVASLNKPLSRYFSAVSHHSSGEELSNDLAMNIIKALQCYRKHNDTLPTHIIVYRDGVGDGQIPYVFDHEVKHIVSAIGQMYGANPKLGFIIVSKKINTRIFCNRANPKPGTVVDDVITLPERYDFFIVSQCVNQGTVSPTSYNVIHDTLGLDPDKIQRMTFKLTHCYYNWSGTVRVPAPVQYAHKLAFLVSQALHRPPNTGLEDLLFFL